MTDMAAHTGGERYTVISADCHGGGDVPDYRPYLERALLDEFDAWRAGFANPYTDLADPGASRNWDHDRRLAELEADGVAAEVIFPNTVPPFFPVPSLVQQPPGPAPAISSCAGPACTPTTAGWPTSAPRRRPEGRASPRSCCTTSTGRWPRCAGRTRRG